MQPVVMHKDLDAQVERNVNFHALFMTQLEDRHCFSHGPNVEINVLNFPRLKIQYVCLYLKYSTLVQPI